MKTQWTITSDHISEADKPTGTNLNAVGIVGPKDATLTAAEIVAHPEARQFQMLDDDRNLYYSGFTVGPDDFAPLDDFGAPNAGATEIRYMNPRGVFETV